MLSNLKTEPGFASKLKKRTYDMLLMCDTKEEVFKPAHSPSLPCKFSQKFEEDPSNLKLFALKSLFNDPNQATLFHTDSLQPPQPLEDEEAERPEFTTQ